MKCCLCCKFSYIENNDGLQCRYKPPIIIHRNGITETIFPLVLPDQWCGKFKKGKINEKK